MVTWNSLFKVVVKKLTGIRDPVTFLNDIKENKTPIEEAWYKQEEFKK